MRRKVTPKKAANHPAGAPQSVPNNQAVLPKVHATVTSAGELELMLDGNPYPRSPYAPAWRREDLATILAGIGQQLGVPFRIEVNEFDGSTFTDILTPKETLRAETNSPPPVLARPAVLYGAGFQPGEDVAVAVLAGFTRADMNGNCTISLDADFDAGLSAGDVIVIGRHSHRIVNGMRNPPADDSFTFE